MIGRNIHKIRKKRGITLSDLAEQANISKSYLSNIERELNDNPSIQVMEKISNVLKVDLQILLDDSSEFTKIAESEWLLFIRELKESGIEIDKLREYKKVFEFVKWQSEVERNAK